MASSKRDTQDRVPDYEIDLERVGITNLKALIKTKHGGKSYRFVADVRIAINLDKSRKGIHMSRLIESITEVFEQEVDRSHSLIEDLGKSVLVKLQENHPYDKGEIIIETDYLLYRKTPVTGKKSTEAYKARVTVRNNMGEFEKSIWVSAMGSTACPHAMEYAGMPHIQRVIGELEVSGPFQVVMNLDDMIDAVEQSFSSETYTLLKTQDEKHVVEKMHDNPKFVEDLVRGILVAAKKMFTGCSIRSRAVSLESIHKHDVVAEGYIN